MCRMRAVSTIFSGNGRVKIRLSTRTGIYAVIPGASSAGQIDVTMENVPLLTRDAVVQIWALETEGLLS